MKLKKFTAHNVYKFLNFEIDFNNDLTFLIGCNGTGKTTVIRLLYSLLTPSWKDLALIPFSKISLEFEMDKKIYEILCEKDDEYLKLSVPKYFEEVLKLELASFDDINNSLSSSSLNPDQQKIINFIEEIPSPFFLGEDRSSKEPRERIEDLSYRERYFSRKRIKDTSNKIFSASLEDSLNESKHIVRDYYKKLRFIEKKLSLKLRDQILLSAFEFTSLDKIDLDRDKSYQDEKALFDKKPEIEGALKKIGIENHSLQEKLDLFFSKFQKLFNNIKDNKDPKISIEWLVNKAQIDKFSKIVQVVNEENTKNKKLFSSIDNYINILNLFFKDSNKKIDIDPVGELSVKIPNNITNPISTLSSGERQLIIIFTHIFFNKFRKKSNIFIIDEPELSLHLNWQIKFISSIKNVIDDSDTQLIMATHSPDIINGRDDKCFNINSFDGEKNA